jgi:hypothetical protein
MIEVDNKKVQYELLKKNSECIEKISDIEALERLLNYLNRQPTITKTAKKATYCWKK